MDTAIVAIIISGVSVLIAGIALGWNIYRDVIITPRVEVSFGVKTLVANMPLPDGKEYIDITATNFGPGPVTVSMVLLMNTSPIKRLLKKTKSAVVIHDYENPFSGQLPKKLEVGERITLLFPYNQECMLNQEWTHVGLSDYFGKSHWAKKEDIQKARERWLSDFGQPTEALPGG